MNYRHDVQILRGLAVLVVVLFHLEIAPFGSGFLGVDIFFVISGYLMALLFDPGAPGLFYLRRARRLLPAYFATVFATVIAVAVVTTPNEFGQVIAQIVNALGFTSNLGFWARDSYFAKADFKPLLHLWSLAVEIQFYLLVPLVAVLVRRLGLGALALVGLLSAALCFALAPVHPESAFFLLPTRIWEFLLGFGVGSALGGATLTGPRARRAGLIAFGALLLIPLLPVIGSGGDFVRGHPGLGALAITVATVIVIAVGLPPGVVESRAGRALEWLGDRSYSIYLAHFPVIVLMLYEPFTGTVTHSPSLARLVAVIAAVAIAGGFLYRFVERPFRQARTGWPSLGAAMAAIIVVTVAGPLWQQARLGPDEKPIFASLSDRDAFRCGTGWAWQHPFSRSCPLNAPPSARGHVFLVGNSYADSLKQALTTIADRHGFQVHLTVENLPLMAEGRLGVGDIVTEARRLDADAIVLHYSADAVEPDTIERLAARARQYGIVTRFIMPVPRHPQNVPRSLLTELRDGPPPPALTLDDYRRAHADARTRLGRIGVPDFRVYEIAQDLCQPDCAIRDEDGALLYYDEHHLTLTGSRHLEPTLEQVIADLDRLPASRIARRPPGTDDDATAVH